MALLGDTTNITISTGYLRELSSDNRKDQTIFAKLKDNVEDKAQEIYCVNNLLTKFDPKQFFLIKVELHSQQAFGKNNLLKLYTVLPVLTQLAIIV